MKRKYYVFVEALLLTIVVFVVGFYIGINVEGGHLTQVNNYYTQSEVSLLDVMSLNNLVNSKAIGCTELVNSDKALLNKVYTEAQVLNQYETSGKLTSDLKTLHTKYDALRTYLWIITMSIKKECPNNVSTIVYLYKHNETDLTKKAEQNVLSKLLLEVKNENSNVVLIPIAEDSGITSLDALTSKYNVTDYPAVIVNEKKIFYSIPQKSDIESYLN